MRHYQYQDLISETAVLILTDIKAVHFRICFLKIARGILKIYCFYFEIKFIQYHLS